MVFNDESLNINDRLSIKIVHVENAQIKMLIGKQETVCVDTQEWYNAIEHFVRRNVIIQLLPILYEIIQLFYTYI